MNSIGLTKPPTPHYSVIENVAAKQAIGQEDTDTKQDIFKAVVESSETNPNTYSPVNTDKSQADQQQKDQAVIQSLASRDRGVRAHEQAHASVGGQYAGAASFTYQRGPNGINYAVGGEVPISAPTGGNAESRLQAAEQIKRAALAPTNPSAQDRQVAAQAAQTATQARAEMATRNAQELSELNSNETSIAETDAAAKSQTNIDASSSKNENSATTQAFKNVTNISQLGSLFNQLV